MCFSGEEDESHLVAVEVMAEQEVRLKTVMVIQNILDHVKVCLQSIKMAKHQILSKTPVQIIGTPMDVAETRINYASFFCGHWLCFVVSASTSGR